MAIGSGNSLDRVIFEKGFNGVPTILTLFVRVISLKSLKPNSKRINAFATGEVSYENLKSFDDVVVVTSLDTDDVGSSVFVVGC